MPKLASLIAPAKGLCIGVGNKRAGILPFAFPLSAGALLEEKSLPLLFTEEWK